MTNSGFSDIFVKQHKVGRYYPISMKFVKDYRRDCLLKYSPIGVEAYAETVDSAGMVLARQGFGVIRIEEIPEKQTVEILTKLNPCSF